MIQILNIERLNRTTKTKDNLGARATRLTIQLLIRMEVFKLCYYYQIFLRMKRPLGPGIFSVKHTNIQV